MVRKKTEGNEEQRRKAAREARERGEAPSAARATTGASKQESHRDAGAGHDERIGAAGATKQQPAGPYPRPHSVERRPPVRKR